ncbi:MAG: hypothetical protein U9Q23_01950, partial [Candidatus Bipolaricaulota bacterium]|nr:hypothetical protein [Candidatus Bipolaricaulota bacterium]
MHGYAEALAHLATTILSRAAILYVNVSYAESCRRNTARGDPQERDSILSHSVPQHEMEQVYQNDDWPVITGGMEGFLNVKGIRVPYVTM